MSRSLRPPWAQATLADRTPLISAGAVAPGAPVNIATIHVLARGGDPDLSDRVAFSSLGPAAPPALASGLAERLSSVG